MGYFFVFYEYKIEYIIVKWQINYIFAHVKLIVTM